MSGITASIFLIIIFLLLKKDGKSSALCFITPLIFTVFLYMNYMSIFSINAKNYIELTRLMYQKEISLPIPEQESVLYLDDGMGSFLLGNKSYLPEFYPLPLQRIGEKDDAASSDIYKKTLERVIKYDGKFISVYESWFFGDGKNSYLKEKLEREYEKIESYPVYSIFSNIFEYSGENSVRYYDIYQRISTTY